MRIGFRDLVTEDEKRAWVGNVMKAPVWIVGGGSLALGYPLGAALHHIDKRTKTMDSAEEKQRERIRYYQALADQHRQGAPV